MPVPLLPTLASPPVPPHGHALLVHDASEVQTLVEDANALTGALAGSRRPDFASEEMQAGTTHYFAQVDNLSGTATHRLHVAEASADRLVVAIENVSTMRYF